MEKLNGNFGICIKPSETSKNEEEGKESYILKVFVGVKVDCINKWSLDRWRITFETPRFLLIVVSYVVLDGDRLDHPFGYRKLALYRTNPLRR